MKLSQCEIGKVVESLDTTITGRPKIGHVVRLTINHSRLSGLSETSEIIPVVHWAGDEFPTPIHHGNIKLHKD